MAADLGTVSGIQSTAYAFLLTQLVSTPRTCHPPA